MQRNQNKKMLIGPFPCQRQSISKLKTGLVFAKNTRCSARIHSKNIMPYFVNEADHAARYIYAFRAFQKFDFLSTDYVILTHHCKYKQVLIRNYCSFYLVMRAKTTLNVYAYITREKKKENIANFENFIKNLSSGASPKFARIHQAKRP